MAPRPEKHPSFAACAALLALCAACGDKPATQPANASASASQGAASAAGSASARASSAAESADADPSTAPEAIDDEGEADSAGGAGPAPSAATTPVTQIIALGTWVPVRREPRRDGALMGYLRAGGITPVTGAAVGRERCPVHPEYPEGGWFRLAGGGYVCVGGALAVPYPQRRGSARPTQPSHDAGMPYDYAIVYGTVNMYRSPLAPSEARVYETWRNQRDGGANDPAPAAASASAAPRRTPEAVAAAATPESGGEAASPSREGDDAPAPSPASDAPPAAASAAPAAAPAPRRRRVETAASEDPAAARRREAATNAHSRSGRCNARCQRDRQREEQREARRARRHRGERREADRRPSVASAPSARSTRSEPARTAPANVAAAASENDGRPRLRDLRGERGGMVIRRLLTGMYVALDRQVTERASGERFWRTQSGGYVRSGPLSVLRSAPTFQGVALDDTRSLPYAFMVSLQGGTYRPSANGTSVSYHRSAPRLSSYALTSDPPIVVGSQQYYRTTDGLAVNARNVRIARLRPPPAGVGPTEKWLDVDLDQQVLVAYEGARPVYTTLVSTGRRSDSNPQRNYETPAGSFRIRGKHISTTMDGDTAADGPYSIEDVPWAMYFYESYALHGAFWHNNFGWRQSHGCVNLSPPDARWVFYWSEPALPEGWHGVFSGDPNTGTRLELHHGDRPTPRRPTL